MHPTQRMIRRIRNMAGVSQAKFAEAYGIPRRTLENWESGERIPPAYVVRLLERAVEADKEAGK